MNATAHTAFSAAMNGLIASASFNERGRIADAWRGSLVEVEEHLMFIRQHRETIAQRNEMLMPKVRRHRPAYVRYARQRLAHRLSGYLAAVRRVSEFEARMDAAGIPYARSSSDWRNS